jgi:hypothetical protein
MASAANPPTLVNAEVGGKPSVQGVHLVSEASGLCRSQQIRGRHRFCITAWLGRVEPAPVYLQKPRSQGLHDKEYGTAVRHFTNAALGSSAAEGKAPPTSLVDKFGNVVVMTTTIESAVRTHHAWVSSQTATTFLCADRSPMARSTVYRRLKRPRNHGAKPYRR